MLRPVLSLENVSSFIGSFHIVQGVSFAVYPGEALVMLGRNGAGKTTTLRTIMGLLRLAKGKIELVGESLAGLETHHIARRGIGYVPEDCVVFNMLTVEENLEIAMHMQDKETKERLTYALDLFPDLKIAYRRFAATLSGGQRQMLAMARSLVNDNKIILIDEPSKGLAPIVVDKMAEALIEVKKRSTLILVEQNFLLACAIGDRYVILDSGKSVKSGTVHELATDEQLQSQYLSIGT